MIWSPARPSSEELSGQVRFARFQPSKEDRPALGVVNGNQLLAQFRPHGPIHHRLRCHGPRDLRTLDPSITNSGAMDLRTLGSFGLPGPVGRTHLSPRRSNLERASGQAMRSQYRGHLQARSIARVL